MQNLVLRRHVLKAGAFLSFSALAGCVSTKPSGDGSDQTEATLGYVNALRKEKGLLPLANDRVAAAAALSQASRMAKAGKMNHLIGIGDSFLDRMKGQNVALPAAENIAAGQNDAEGAYQAWYRSPKHLENMLGSGYRGLGVAVVRNPASGNRPYWAMILSSSG